MKERLIFASYRLTLHFNLRKENCVLYIERGCKNISICLQPFSSNFHSIRSNRSQLNMIVGTCIILSFQLLDFSNSDLLFKTPNNDSLLQQIQVFPENSHLHNLLEPALFLSNHLDQVGVEQILMPLVLTFLLLHHSSLVYSTVKIIFFNWL